MSHPLRLVCLVALALGVSAPAAQAAKSVQLSVSTSGDPRGVQLDISPIGAGTALETTVAGTAAGVLTVSDPGGIQLFAVPGAPCAEVDANTATCGVAGDPVTYLTVTGGAQNDSVDLSGLATQVTSRGAFSQFPAAFDVDLRMRGIFANVLTAGGADEITGGAVGTRYEPGDGNDTVHGGPGDEVFRAGAEPTDGADVFAGGGGYDTMSYAARTVAVSGILGDGLTSGLGGGIPGGENDSVDGVEALVGGRSDDTLAITGQLGGLGTLSGAAGADTLTGGPGSDKLTGGSGKDELFGGDGDDQLTDPGIDRAFVGLEGPNVAGHLNGGGGDDELFQRSAVTQFPPFADGIPSCGSGADVLRADPGIDEGVGLFAGPADCELLATAGGGDSSITDVPRVGKTVTVTPAAGLLGTPVAGRMGQTTWEVCTNGVPTCEQRKTDGPQITFGPGDVGKSLLFASVRLNEPLSQAARWVEERRVVQQQFAPVLTAFLTNPGTILDVEPIKPPPSKPDPPVQQLPDAAAALKSVKSPLGSTLKLLRKSTSITFQAPRGSKVTVELSVKKGKTVAVLSRGTGTADAAGKVTLALRPTKAGKRVAKAGQKTTVGIQVTVVTASGTAVAKSSLALRKR